MNYWLTAFASKLEAAFLQLVTWHQQDVQLAVSVPFVLFIAILWVAAVAMAVGRKTTITVPMSVAMLTAIGLLGISKFGLV